MLHACCRYGRPPTNAARLLGSDHLATGRLRQGSATKAISCVAPEGGAGSDRGCLGCLVLWPAQKVGAVWDDAGVRERPDVGEVGGVDLGTAGAHAPRDNLGPGGLSVN